MAEILQFKPKQTEKFGFKKVQKKTASLEAKQQLDLFRAQQADLLQLPLQIDPFELALILDERNDPKAIEAYQNAIEGSDLIADAYCNLGILLSKEGRLDDAFDCLSKALVNDSRHFESHYNLANLYFDIENFRLAKCHYQFAAKIDDSYSNLYFNLGLVLAMENEYQAAIDVLTTYRNLVTNHQKDKADSLINTLKRSIK